MNSFLFACSLASSLLTQNPRLSITQPFGQTIDKKIHIQVEDLEPFQEIELRAEAKDNKENTWSAQAMFRANAEGMVDLASSCPIYKSSYADIDEMGLFWSMLPAFENTLSSFKCKNDVFPVEVKLYISGHLSEQKTVTSYLKAPDVKRIDVRENNLVGTFFIPQAKKRLPVIITLSGSNGGLSENRAKLLASNGFAVFALAYFRFEGLPSNLQDIPLEYFSNAFKWLKEQSNIDSSHIGLYGVSRGAELSLIIGSLFPESVQAIVAVAPSSVVYGGLNEKPVDAWIYQGKPILPFATVPHANFADGKGETPENPVNTRKSFLEGMKDKAVFKAASIPVENIQCPLLLVSGGDDQMWPSDLYAQQIIDRLEKNQSLITLRHLHYPHAGHGINIPNLPIPEPTYYHPVGKLWFSLGGTRADDAKASSNAWNELVTFFHKSLSDKVNRTQ